MLNISFYEFVKLDNLLKLKKELQSYIKKNNLKGKILLAKEGINGMLSGEEKDIREFEKYINSFDQFKKVWFKENPVSKHTYKRSLVKIRKEIITFKIPVDMKKTANHMSPEELKQMYDNNEDFVIIDTRNYYEYDVGHFKNAIKLETKEFTEFPQELERIRPQIEGKKIVTYCTGGVRCEKATAYMKEQGFEDVHQLNGGIVNYGDTIGGAYWEGKCFVFDERGAVDIDPRVQAKNQEYSQCSVCYVPNEDKHTCLNCSKEFVMCPNCTPLMDNCCSKFCRNKLREREALVSKV